MHSCGVRDRRIEERLLFSSVISQNATIGIIAVTPETDWSDGNELTSHVK
jgi:hypothetical protein